MTKETYLKMTQPFRDHSKMAKSLHICNRILTVAIFAAYPLLLLWLLWNKNPLLARAIILPLDGFIIVSVVRLLVNRRRPYEKFEVPSVIPKKTKGKSWPSRHVFSAAVIAMTFLTIPQLFVVGMVFLLFSLALAVIRVLSGVHYISDVIAGFLFAVVCVAVPWLMGF